MSLGIDIDGMTRETEELRASNDAAEKEMLAWRESCAARDRLYDSCSRERDAAQARVKELDQFTPTSENINKLPESLRRYICDLETNCDPAGMVAQNILTMDQNKHLQASLYVALARVEELEAHAKRIGTACLKHDLVGGWACPICMEELTGLLRESLTSCESGELYGRIVAAIGGKP